jgi:hypothetical protein
MATEIFHKVLMEFILDTGVRIESLNILSALMSPFSFCIQSSLSASSSASSSLLLRHQFTSFSHSLLSFPSVVPSKNPRLSFPYTRREFYAENTRRGKISGVGTR